MSRLFPLALLTLLRLAPSAQAARGFSFGVAHYGIEIDDTIGQEGSGALVDAGFFTPPPPQGVGMQCSVIDRFSYGQVRVTSNRLTVTPKDIDGNTISDNGRPCGVTLDFTP